MTLFPETTRELTMLADIHRLEAPARIAMAGPVEDDDTASQARESLFWKAGLMGAALMVLSLILVAA